MTVDDETQRSSERRLAIVVVNPMSRSGADRVLRAVQKYAPPDIELEVCFTSPNRRVRDLVGDRIDQAHLVIAAGGDGTVADVVTAIGSANTPVGIIPVGSTNVVARENRIPLKPEAAAKLIFGNHHILEFDVGTCGDLRFLHMAGAGIDSRLFSQTNPVWKRRIGWMAYLPPTANSLLSPPAMFTITADGSTIKVKSPLVLVANGASIVRSAIPIYPDVHKDDGYLDVIVITAVNSVQIARALFRFATRGLHRSPYAIHLRARSIRMESDPPIPVQIDGDVIGETPAEFGVLPCAAHLIVPMR